MAVSVRCSWGSSLLAVCFPSSCDLSSSTSTDQHLDVSSDVFVGWSGCLCLSGCLTDLA